MAGCKRCCFAGELCCRTHYKNVHGRQEVVMTRMFCLFSLDTECKAACYRLTSLSLQGGSMPLFHHHECT
eukprot:755499-Hanusia_phi.AAC.1